MTLPSTRMILFNAAGAVIGVSVLIGLIRPLLITPTPPPCSQRYQHSMTFQLARAGSLLSAADLQSALGGKDLVVIDNLSIGGNRMPRPPSACGCGCRRARHRLAQRRSEKAG